MRAKTLSTPRHHPRDFMLARRREFFSSLVASNMDAPGRYQANAFTPQTAARVNSGHLRVTTDGIRFESATANGALPMSGLVVRRGGHNGEQIFFEHPQLPGWSIYTSDPALLRDPILRVQPEIAHQFRAVDKSRKATPLPVRIALLLLALFFGGLLLLWT